MARKAIDLDRRGVLGAVSGATATLAAYGMAQTGSPPAGQRQDGCQDRCQDRCHEWHRNHPRDPADRAAPDGARAEHVPDLRSSAIERAVCDLGFERVDLMRPGFLLGGRSEPRVWEAIGQRVFAALNPILLGPLSRYGAIPAETVADAIVALVGQGAPGRHVHENEQMRRLAAQAS